MVASASTYYKIVIKTAKQLVVTTFSIDLVISWAAVNGITTRTTIYPIHTLFTKDQIRHIFSKYLIVYEKIMCTSLYKILMIGSNCKSFPLYYIFTIFTFNTQVFCWHSISQWDVVIFITGPCFIHY